MTAYLAPVGEQIEMVNFHLRITSYFPYLFFLKTNLPSLALPLGTIQLF